MSTKSKSRNVNTAASNPIHYVGYTSSFLLPKLKKWKKHFLNVCKNLRLLPYVLKADISGTGQLCVTTNSSDAMAYVNSIVEKEIEIFINRQQPLARLSLPSKPLQNKKWTVSHVRTNDKLKSNISNAMHRILQRKQKCLTKYSRLSIVNKKKRIDRKKWYELDKKSKRKKTILKYIRQEIKYRRRHHFVSLYQQQKWSSFEYRQKKIIGRRRDRLKSKHASIAKTRFEPNRDQKKVLCPYKHTTTYGSHVNSDKISAIDSKNSAKWPTKLCLNSYFHFPEAAINSARSLTCDNDKILLRYSNQRVFIYVLSVNHCNRPSKKNLINTFSTIDNIQSGFFDKHQSLPAPARRTTTLVKSRHYDGIACQSAPSGKQKTKKSKRKPKKTVK